MIETLPKTKRIELINKKEFTQTALDQNAESFMIYVSVLLPYSIHPDWEA